MVLGLEAIHVGVAQNAVIEQTEECKRDDLTKFLRFKPSVPPIASSLAVSPRYRRLPVSSAIRELSQLTFELLPSSREA